MHKIHFNSNEYVGPSRWEEISAENLLRFARATYRLGCTDMVKHVLVKLMMDIPYKDAKLLKEYHLIQLHVCVDWLFEKNTLSKWLLKTVKSGNKKLFGPENKLSNLTGNEFIYVEAAYEQWLQDQKNDHLSIIFAVLYRKRHWFTRKRIPFNPENLNQAVLQTKSVPAFVKHAVAINYAGCRNLIIASHPHIWKKVQDGQTTEGKVSITSWASNFLQLAGDKFGTYEQTMKTKVWLLLADLDTKAKHVKEMEARAK